MKISIILLGFICLAGSALSQDLCEADNDSDPFLSTNKPTIEANLAAEKKENDPNMLPIMDMGIAKIVDEIEFIPANSAYTEEEQESIEEENLNGEDVGNFKANSEESVTFLSRVSSFGYNLGYNTLWVCGKFLCQIWKVVSFIGNHLPCFGWEFEEDDYTMPIHGLVNIGNTCYLNATTQALYACEGFRNFVAGRPGLASEFDSFFRTLSDTPIAKQRIINPKTFFSNIQKTLAANDKANDEKIAKKAKEEGKTITKVGHFSAEMKNQSLQHDAGEFLIHILNLMETESKSVSEESVAEFDSTFKVKTEDITKCQGCEKASPKELLQNYLSVYLTGNSLEECLKNMTEEEVLSDDNRWNCETEGCSGNTIRQFRITEWPNILIVQLNRFLAADIKNTAKVKYPSETTFGGQNYSLASVILHIGATIQSGHFIASVRHSDGKWYIADDYKITGPMEFKAMDNAYILIYEKNDATDI